MKSKDRILYNAVKTPDGTIIESIHRHDFVMYTDKNGKQYGVDGGAEYLRRLGDIQDCEELSIYDIGEHSLRRRYCKWGSNYDKDMNRLPETIWKSIKDLDTDHIQAILDGGHAKNNPFYENMFKQEILYRKQNPDENFI